MSAKFYIEHQNKEYIYIIDTGIEDISVREDAKDVVTFLKEQCDLCNRRIIYRNRNGHDNEIMHKNGNFICYGLGHKGIVLPIESETLLECMKTSSKYRNKTKT